MISYRNLGLHGRLGNALFELAATIGIALDRGEEPIFPENWLHRPYFSVPDQFFGPIPPDAVEATEFAGHLDPRARPYLQDINLFWHHIDVIRQYLQPSEAAQSAVVNMPGIERLCHGGWMGVHVRRGDNVYDPGVPNKSDYHLCPPLEYYQRGIAQFTRGHDYTNIAVFSDDIPWCREFLAEADFFGEGQAYWKEHEERFGIDAPRDWVDFFALAGLGNLFVISNSTFGIWAAILADTECVVRPDKIYGPIVAEYTDSELMFPPEWRTVATGF